MRATNFDMGIPQTPPVGLGWWAFPIAGTTAYHHAGGSPGGVSSFCIIPEYDAVIISFATGPGASALHDALHNETIAALTGRSVTLSLKPTPQPIPAEVAGEYRSFQLQRTAEVKGDQLVVTSIYEPYDEEHREFFKDMFTTARFPPVAYRSIGSNQYAPSGAEPKDYSGFLGRSALLATLPATAKRRAGLHTGLRYTPKVSS
jgi:hypothetical protein